MKIVLSCVRYPPAPGGAEDHVAALAEAYVARGHEVRVHTTDLFKEVPFERRELPTERNGVRIKRHRAYTPGTMLHYTVPPAMTRALLADARDADVLHTHSYGYFQTMATAYAAKRTRTPFVFTPHYHPPWSMEGGAARKVMRTVYDPTFGRYVLRRADRIIGVSTGEIEELARNMPLDRSKVRIVPNGFHHEAFDPRPDGAAFRAHIGVGPDTPLVLFAGRLASNKGLHILLHAFALAANAHPDAILVIAGEDQDQRARLEALARDLRIEPRVRFTGHLPGALYPSALAAATVFVLPSEWEAFGIVLAQAMACGVPCVATRVGGAPDVVVDGKTGLLVPYGDANALSDAIAGLLADAPQRAAMGEAGRERAFERYSWARVADRTLDVYTDLL